MLHEKSDRVAGLENDVVSKLPEEWRLGFEAQVVDHWDNIMESWDKRREKIKGFKVFQEGFTREVITGLSRTIATMGRAEAAKSFGVFLGQGSSSYGRFTQRLLEGGAQFEITEDQALYDGVVRNVTLASGLMARLLDESGASMGDNLSDVIDGHKDLEGFYVSIESLSEERKSLNDSRDRFVARQINNSLRSSETGLLTFGAQHDPFKYLQRDVKVELVEENVAEFVESQIGRRGIFTVFAKER